MAMPGRRRGGRRSCSSRTGCSVDRVGRTKGPRFIHLSSSCTYPPYWHYDVLHGLLVLSRMGLATDPRASDALDLLERRRLKDGRFRPGAYWWRPHTRGRQANGGVDPGDGPNAEVVDWGRSAPNEMITLNALRVLRAAGRL